MLENGHDGLEYGKNIRFLFKSIENTWCYGVHQIKTIKIQK
jgi:hypothetical protein